MARIPHHTGRRTGPGDLHTTGICDTRMVKKNANKINDVVSLDLYRSKKQLQQITELYLQMDRAWKWVDDTLSSAPSDIDRADVYLAAMKLSVQRLRESNFKPDSILNVVISSLKKPKK